MKTIASLLVYVLLFGSFSYAESELNNKDQCDPVAMRRLCSNSPFPDAYIVNTPDLVNLRFCSDFSKTYKFDPDEIITKDSLNEYCRGVY